MLNVQRRLQAPSGFRAARSPDCGSGTATAAGCALTDLKMSGFAPASTGIVWQRLTASPTLGAIDPATTSLEC